MRPYKSKRSEEVAIQFGKNLARARRIADLSQEALAQRASLHRTEIGMLEHGQRVARIDTLLRVSGSVEAMPNELLDGIAWVPSASPTGSFVVSTRIESLRSANDG